MYSIEAIICDKSVGEQFIHDHNLTIRLILLTEEIALLPITQAVLKEIKINETSSIEGFSVLNSGILSIIVSYSVNGRVGFIEAEYFGGTGSQSSVMYQNGALVTNEINSENAINNLLRSFGVKRNATNDEFTVLDLGRFRKTDDWVLRR